MTIQRILASFFVMYGILIPVLAQEFVTEYTSAAIAILGSCIIIAMLFWSKRALFINIALAFYVFQNYLSRPYVSIFDKELSGSYLIFIKVTNSYFTAESATIVYWNLFFLLLAWLIGLLLSKNSHRGNLKTVPKLFSRIDSVLLKGGPPFWFSWLLLVALNYASPESGLRATEVVGGSGLFLFGLGTLAVINLTCLYIFLRSMHAKMRPIPYYLLFPTLLELSGFLYGARSAVFSIILSGILYYLMLNQMKEFRLKEIGKTLLVVSILALISIVAGLFAQVLRPLYRYSESVSTKDILQVLDFRFVLFNKDNLIYGLSELLHRFSSLPAQFYILNDWYIYEPWKYFNPLTTVMRTINDLVPGDVFKNMLTINQLFSYMYNGTILIYNSEMWGIQGTLYLYFGYIFAPIVVLLFAVFLNRFYLFLENAIKSSPAFAAFFIFLLGDIFTNGTLERIIPVDIVRPLVSFVIFLVLYKAFSVLFPISSKLSKRQVIKQIST